MVVATPAVTPESFLTYNMDTVQANIIVQSVNSSAEPALFGIDPETNQLCTDAGDGSGQAYFSGQNSSSPGALSGGPLLLTYQSAEDSVDAFVDAVGGLTFLNTETGGDILMTCNGALELFQENATSDGSCQAVALVAVPVEEDPVVTSTDVVTVLLTTSTITADTSTVTVTTISTSSWCDDRKRDIALTSTPTSTSSTSTTSSDSTFPTSSTSPASAGGDTATLDPETRTINTTPTSTITSFVTTTPVITTTTFSSTVTVRYHGCGEQKIALLPEHNIKRS